MPKIAYRTGKFRRDSLEMIETVNRIIVDYSAQGFDLTLRQLYYQLVARGIIPNNDKEYKRIGDLVNNARLAGLIDWESIVDRTRSLRGRSHWQEPGDIILSAAASFAVDRWAGQPFRPEVWVEKDALTGVIGGVCNRLDVPFFSCRGYTSQSEMWVAAQRLERYLLAGQVPVILHLGDHDPSGKDMTRDIGARLELFMGGLKVDRLALNWDQIEQYNPPPNPAKLTDSRVDAYIAEFGSESWELDALEPSVIVALIERAVEQVRDADQWAAAEQRELEGQDLLKKASRMWDQVAAMLESDQAVPG